MKNDAEGVIIMFLVKNTERKLVLLAEKALRIIARHRMKNFDQQKLKAQLHEKMNTPDFNLYRFLQPYL